MNQIAPWWCWKRAFYTSGVLLSLTVFSLVGIGQSSNPGTDRYDGKHFLIEGTEDWDKDGRTGDAENGDGDDVFADLAFAFPPNIYFGPRVVTIMTDGVYRVGYSMVTGDTTVQAGQGVNAVLDGRDDEGTLGAPFLITGKLTLRNLTIQRYSTGALVQDGGNLIAENCVFSRNRLNGDLIENGGNAVFRNCSIVRNGLHDTHGEGAIPGGLVFGIDATGLVSRSLVAGNAGTPIVRNPKKVLLKEVDVAR